MYSTGFSDKPVWDGWAIFRPTKSGLNMLQQPGDRFPSRVWDRLIKSQVWDRLPFGIFFEISDDFSINGNIMIMAGMNEGFHQETSKHEGY